MHGQWKTRNSDSLNRRFKTHDVELGLTSRDLSNYGVKRRQEMSYKELMDLIRYHDSRGCYQQHSLGGLLF